MKIVRSTFDIVKATFYCLLLLLAQPLHAQEWWDLSAHEGSGENSGRSNSELHGKLHRDPFKRNEELNQVLLRDSLLIRSTVTVRRIKKLNNEMRLALMVLQESRLSGYPISRCISCEGAGVEGCGKCRGRGYLTCPVCEGITGFACRLCEGDGMVGEVDCTRCGGNGQLECRNCSGKRRVICSACDGVGGWNCAACHGLGELTAGSSLAEGNSGKDSMVQKTQTRQKKKN